MSSLVPGYANAERMEESNSWRYPIDLIDILEKAFKKLSIVVSNGSRTRRQAGGEKITTRWNQRKELLIILLGDELKKLQEQVLATVAKK